MPCAVAALRGKEAGAVLMSRWVAWNPRWGEAGWLFAEGKARAGVGRALPYNVRDGGGCALPEGNVWTLGGRSLLEGEMCGTGVDVPSLREMCRTGGRCVLLKNVRAGGRCALPEGKAWAAGAPTVPEQSAGRGWSRPP